jgi:hypothetical protein
MISLYDYLGKPAGKELGLQVSKYAFQIGVKPQKRQISNPKYTGVVYVYPKDFLELYFKSINPPPPKDVPLSKDFDYDDDLPF